MWITVAHAADNENGHGADAAFPPFDPTYFGSQILWLIITFAALYLIMDRVVIPRLSGILELRRDRISRDLDEAQRMRSEADAAQAAYEHDLAEAKRNAHEIAAEATEKAKKEAGAAREKVEAELAEKMSEAESRIAEIKARALGEVDAIASEAVGDIVGQLIGGKVTQADITKAIAAVKN